MFSPALFSGWLVAKLGTRTMIFVGLVFEAACVIIAISGKDVAHYWGALVLLGIGWNFLFLSGTNLLPSGYRPEERFRVQSLNDFIVFSVQAIVSLSSGWFLFHLGWRGILISCFPLIAAFSLLLIKWRRNIDLQRPNQIEYE